jgi:chemotaxis methyl-accepting protein methylase
MRISEEGNAPTRHGVPPPAQLYSRRNKAVASLYPRLKILSFGCSTGEEVRTLSEKYFPGCIIHGIDINKAIVAQTSKSNTNPFEGAHDTISEEAMKKIIDGFDRLDL